MGEISITTSKKDTPKGKAKMKLVLSIKTERQNVFSILHSVHNS